MVQNLYDRLIQAQCSSSFIYDSKVSNTYDSLTQLAGSNTNELQTTYAIEYGIFGEGFHILTNQKGESTVFSLVIGRNLRPFPDNTVLYSCCLEKKYEIYKKGVENINFHVFRNSNLV